MVPFSCSANAGSLVLPRRFPRIDRCPPTERRTCVGEPFRRLAFLFSPVREQRHRAVTISRPCTADYAFPCESQSAERLSYVGEPLRRLAPDTAAKTASREAFNGSDTRIQAMSAGEKYRLAESRRVPQTQSSARCRVLRWMEEQQQQDRSNERCARRVEQH